MIWFSFLKVWRRENFTLNHENWIKCLNSFESRRISNRWHISFFESLYSVIRKRCLKLDIMLVPKKYRGIFCSIIFFGLCLPYNRASLISYWFTLVVFFLWRKYYTRAQITWYRWNLKTKESTNQMAWFSYLSHLIGWFVCFQISSCIKLFGP